MASHRKAEKRSGIPCACGCGRYPMRGKYCPGHWYRVPGHLRTGGRQGDERSGGETAQDYDPIVVFTPARWSPEQALMEAILANMLAHLRQQAVCLKKRRCLMCEENRQWVLSEDSHYLYSFLSVCLHLGIKAEKLRARICDGTLPPYLHQHTHLGRPPQLR